MMLIQKPQTFADLVPPFQRIGEPGWEGKLRDVLTAYAVPLPDPVPTVEIIQREAMLGRSFPAALCHVLHTFGPLNFDGLRLFHPDEIDYLYHSPWYHRLPRSSHLQVDQMLQIAEAAGDNSYVLTFPTQACGLCSHDPIGFFEWVPCLDDLIRKAVIDLSWSRYGWPDSEVADLAETVKRGLFDPSFHP